MNMKKNTKFIELKQIYEILHSPKGCMWDRKQTHKSLIPYLKEETQEFIEAVRGGNDHHIQEELGDVLLQVMFHAQIAAKEERFNIEDVIDGLIRKIKRRHPHVFGNIKVNSTHQIKRNWDRIKELEKKEKTRCR